MDAKIFYGLPPTYFRVLPEVDESELADLSDGNMAPDNINYFKVFIADSGDVGSTYHIANNELSYRTRIT